MHDHKVVIVGGGLAGLSCAKRLLENGISSLVFESSDEIGGRASSVLVDGYTLDRGFQVLLTAYPEATKVLDYEQLQLKRFEPGALVRFRGNFHRFVDPWRRPRHLIGTALSPLAGFADKLRVARLRNRLCRGSLEETFNRKEESTLNRLRRNGFSDSIIERFFKPFLGGVFLERELVTSSRMFDFVFRMFAVGDASLPAKGMGAIADQISQNLPRDSIRTNTRVSNVESNRVHLENGEVLNASKVVVACEEPVAAKLLGEDGSNAGHGVTCIYFAADKSPVNEPILVLNGDENGPINNLCVPSDVSSNYSPEGKALISVSVIGALGESQSSSLHEDVVEQLRAWYGPPVNRWQHLKTYSIPYALPIQNTSELDPPGKSKTRSGDIFVCGDYLQNASINGAMLSGRLAAESVIGSI